MGVLDYLILGCIVLAIILAVRHVKKKGGCSGCSGNCSSCKKNKK